MNRSDVVARSLHGAAEVIWTSPRGAIELGRAPGDHVVWAVLIGDVGVKQTRIVSMRSWLPSPAASFVYLADLKNCRSDDEVVPSPQVPATAEA